MNEKAENSNASNLRTKVYGSKLKSARVSLQKSIEEIAAELNLHKNIIESIEEMDEKKLPSAVFVKGYIRTYAKFVQIQSEDLIKDFSDIDETEVVIEIAKNKSDLNFEPNFKLSLVVIVIIVLILMFFSFNNTEDTGERLVEKTDIQAAIVVNDDNQSITEEVNVIENSVNEDALTTEETSPIEKVIESEESEVQSEEVVEIDAVSNAVTEKTDIDSTNGLLVIANEDSWMEIRNSENKRVFSNVLAKGEQKYFSDSERYKLIIGRSHVVKIEYFGKAINFETFTKSNGISRFDITKDGLSEFSVPKEAKKEIPVKDLEI